MVCLSRTTTRKKFQTMIDSRIVQRLYSSLGEHIILNQSQIAMTTVVLDEGVPSAMLVGQGLQNSHHYTSCCQYFHGSARIAVRQDDADVRSRGVTMPVMMGEQPPQISMLTPLKIYLNVRNTDQQRDHGIILITELSISRPSSGDSRMLYLRGQRLRLGDLSRECLPLQFMDM